MEFPWVTCICPTANRADMLPAAVECFLQQSYPNKTLLIMDDGEQPFSLVENLPSWHWSEQVLYNRRSKRLPSIGAKRNALCEMARSKYIAHWDDDDWYHPFRLMDQVKILETPKAPGEFPPRVTGYNEVPFYHVDSGVVTVFKGRNTYAVGSSLMYLRDWWELHPFIESPLTPQFKGQSTANNGEDTVFVMQAGNGISCTTGVHRMVARVHKRGTTLASQDFDASCWTRYESMPLPETPSVCGLPMDFQDMLIQRGIVSASYE